FVRYAPLLSRAGAKVIVEAQPELVSLLSTVDGVLEIFSREQDLPEFDVHCPLPSLPHAFRTGLASLPAEIPYLRSPPERLAKWRERMEQLRKPRVALAWSGNPVHPNDRHRSIPLALLDPLLSTPGVQFISVQRDLRSGEPELLAGNGRILQLGDKLADFADTAAVVAFADLVISADTAVAHLAGSLGEPVWILLPFAPDWRWMLERQDSPWYPTARLFRQTRIGEWEDVIARMHAELTRLLQGNTASLADSGKQPSERD